MIFISSLKMKKTITKNWEQYWHNYKPKNNALLFSEKGGKTITCKNIFYPYSEQKFYFHLEEVETTTKNEKKRKNWRKDYTSHAGNVQKPTRTSPAPLFFLLEGSMYNSISIPQLRLLIASISEIMWIKFGPWFRFQQVECACMVL